MTLDLSWVNDLHDDEPVTITYTAAEVRGFAHALKVTATAIAYKRAARRYSERVDEDADWAPLPTPLIDAKWRDEYAAQRALFDLLPTIDFEPWEKHP